MKTLNFIEAVKLAKETGKEFYSENWSNMAWRVFFDKETETLKGYGDSDFIKKRQARKLSAEELIEYLEDGHYVMVSNTPVLKEFMRKHNLDKQSLLELIEELDNE